MHGVADVGGTGNDAATDAPQQHDVLPQYEVPGTLWPQQQPGPVPLQNSGIWGNVAGQMYPAHPGGWPPLQAVQWAQQHTGLVPPMQHQRCI